MSKAVIETLKSLLDNLPKMGGTPEQTEALARLLAGHPDTSPGELFAKQLVQSGAQSYLGAVYETDHGDVEVVARYVAGTTPAVKLADLEATLAEHWLLPQVPGAPTVCSVCGGQPTWDTQIRIRTAVVQGRLNTHDVECVFFLGCEECSETLHVITADKVAALLSIGVQGAQRPTLPDGWVIARDGLEIRVISPPAGPGFTVLKEGANKLESRLLFALASDHLKASEEAPEAAPAGYGYPPAGATP